MCGLASEHIKRSVMCLATQRSRSDVSSFDTYERRRQLLFRCITYRRRFDLFV